jgi:transcriptional regulator with XRE-family HTH domain
MNRLKELRKDKHLYQKDLANLCDVSVSTYSYWESGAFQPDTSTLIKLADYFNVSVDYLLGRDPVEVSLPAERSTAQVIIDDDEERDLIICFRSITREAKDAILNNAHTAVMLYSIKK